MFFIIYDLEATCWLGRPPRGVQEIIEIGAVKLNRYGEVINKFNRFVKPIVNPNLSAFCKKLTSITQENINTASTFDKVIADFIDWIDADDYILCSWGEQDTIFLYNDCLLHNIDTSWMQNYRGFPRTTDLKEQYYKLLGLEQPVSLKKALTMEGKIFEGRKHRAIADAENLVKIFKSKIDIWAY